MSAPERMWIDRGPNGGWMKRFEKMPDSEYEYVRRDTTHTDADLERAVRAALEAAAKYVETHEVGVNPRLGYVIGPSMLDGTLGKHVGMAYADAIRALDPAEIVRRKGE